MNKTSHIRQAVAADEAQVFDCAQDAYEQFVTIIGQKPAPMVADFGAMIAAGYVYVLVQNQTDIAGFIIFVHEGDIVLLENVAVRSNSTGMGFGKRLIAFCEDQAKRLGAKSVTLYTNEKMTANLSLYPRLGYQETGRKTQDGFNRVFFEKRVL